MELATIHEELDRAGLPVVIVRQFGGNYVPEFSRAISAEEGQQVQSIITRLQIQERQAAVTVDANGRVDDIVGNGRARDRILMEVLLKVVVAFAPELNARLAPADLEIITEAEAKGIKVISIRTHEASLKSSLANGESPDVLSGWPT